MLYRYVGYNKDKKILSGVIEAPSLRQAIHKLEGEEGVSVILELKPASALFFKRKLSAFKDRLISSSVGRILQKSTMKIELKDIEAIHFLKQAGLKRIEELQKVDIEERISDIFAQPAEKAEFKPKRERKITEKEVNWDLIKKNPGNVKKLRIPFREIIYFTRQLAVLLASGVALPASLMALAEHTRNKKMKRVINEINQEVQSGNSLSVAMANYPNQFNDLYVSLIYVGESSGTLPECLRDLADFQELQMKVKKKTRNALIYHAIILIVVSVLLVLGSRFFIPMFEELFVDLGMELPKLTRTVFWLARYMDFIIFGVVAFAVFMFMVAPHMKSFYTFMRQYTDRLFLRVPVLKRIILTISMFYFTNPLALMQKNGIRLVDSLRMAYNVVPNFVIKEEIMDATYLLMEGVSMSEALSEQPHFDSIVCSMIKTGEDSGSLERTLEHLSQYYAEQLVADTESLVQAVQPVTILIIAAIVIPIFFAIAIPLLDVTSGSFMR